MTYMHALKPKIILRLLQNRSSRVLVAPEALRRSYRIAFRECLWRPKHFGAPTESFFEGACGAQTINIIVNDLH